MVAGALAGLILSLTQASNPWVGAGVTSNIVQALGASIATGLLARGACWIWLARQA
jgi:stage V sporulation protein SpoVS